MAETGQGTDDASRIQQYAWNWFQYHAQQRLSAFRFFLLFLSILAVGYYTALTAERHALVLLVAVVGCVVSLAFLILEFRNEQLVNLGRDALSAYEESGPFTRLDERLGRLDSERLKLIHLDRKRSLLTSHKFWLRFIYGICIAIFLLAGIDAIARWSQNSGATAESTSVTSPAPSAWETVVLPLVVGLGAALVGGACTLVAAWLTISRTEWYRRLSRWEPYSERLWAFQIELYAKLCIAARNTMKSVHRLAWNVDRGAQQRCADLVENYEEAHSEMTALAVHGEVILSPKFNETYARFAKKVFLLASSSPDPREREHKTSDSDEMFKLYGELVDAAREAVGTDRLDERTREAIFAGARDWSKRGQNRGNGLPGSNSSSDGPGEGSTSASPT